MLVGGKTAENLANSRGNLENPVNDKVGPMRFQFACRSVPPTDANGLDSHLMATVDVGPPVTDDQRPIPRPASNPKEEKA